MRIVEEILELNEKYAYYDNDELYNKIEQLNKDKEEGRIINYTTEEVVELDEYGYEILTVTFKVKYND